jgi:hypothetical protein
MVHLQGCLLCLHCCLVHSSTLLQSAVSAKQLVSRHPATLGFSTDVSCFLGCKHGM